MNNNTLGVTHVAIQCSILKAVWRFYGRLRILKKKDLFQSVTSRHGRICLMLLVEKKRYIEECSFISVTRTIFSVVILAWKLMLENGIQLALLSIYCRCLEEEVVFLHLVLCYIVCLFTIRCILLFFIMHIICC